MKKITKKIWLIFKIAAIVSCLFLILVLATLVVLLGEWAIFGVIAQPMVYEDIVLGFLGSTMSMYLLVKLSNITEYIVLSKLD